MVVESTKELDLKGSLEAYASATGVRDTAIELLQETQHSPSLLENYPINELTSETAFKMRRTRRFSSK